jgi:hypothetical protein
VETTKLRLALRLQAVSEDLAKRAENGEFSDFESQYATPKINLYKELMRIKSTSGNLKRVHDAYVLAQEVKNGLWDETKEEAEAWFQREGKDLLP